MNLRNSSQYLRAALVSVDYGDLLALTLRYNRHHFKDVLVVTTSRDQETIDVAERNGCHVFTTDAFYEGGARFRKWLALERGLEHFGRDGWLCLMDADVCWPKELPSYDLQVGKLYTPLRYMCPSRDVLSDKIFPTVPFMLRVPDEIVWSRYPIHRNIGEWAGYSQIFHCSDPVLGPPPWHETDWAHAGGADSFFQQKWPKHSKVRPPFHVLHIGEAGVNWGGRASMRLDGSVPQDSLERREYMARLWIERRTRGKGDWGGEKVRD